MEGEDKYNVSLPEQKGGIEDPPQKNEVPIHMREGFEKWLERAQDWDINYKYYNEPEVIEKLREKSPLGAIILDGIVSGRRSLLHRWPATQYEGLEDLEKQFDQLEEWVEQINCPVSKPDTSQLNRLKNRMARFSGGTAKGEMDLWLEDLSAEQKPDPKNIAEYPPVLVPFQDAIKELESQLDQDTIAQLTTGEKKPDEVGSEEFVRLIANARLAGGSTVLLGDCQKILDLGYETKEYKKDCASWAESNNVPEPPDLRMSALILSNVNEELMANRRAVIPTHIKEKLVREGMNQALIDEIDISNLASHSLVLRRILSKREEDPRIILSTEISVINNPEELYVLFMAFLNRAYIGSKVYARDSKTPPEDIYIKTAEADGELSFTLSYRPEKILSGVTEFNVDLLSNIFENWDYTIETHDDKVDVKIFTKQSGKKERG